jgi:hypothetical protein
MTFRGLRLAKKTKRSEPRAGKRKQSVPPEVQSLAVKAQIEVPEGTPAFYTNFVEVSNSPWDFSLIFARLPAKPNLSKYEEIKASGVLPITAEITINFPPTLMAGLIRALNTQKEIYEKMTGTELTELKEISQQ